MSWFWKSFHLFHFFFSFSFSTRQRVHENGIITSHSSKDFTTFFDPNKIKKNNSSLSFFENYQDKKLEKNRESARNSRKRKKLYIEMLENRVFIF